MLTTIKTLKRIENRTYFWLLLSGAVVLSVFYMFSVNRAVIFVAERESIETKISALNIQTTELESKYIVMRNAITLELATSLGYMQTNSNQTNFIPKRSVSVLPLGSI